MEKNFRERGDNWTVEEKDLDKTEEGEKQMVEEIVDENEVYTETPHNRESVNKTIKNNKTERSNKKSNHKEMILSSNTEFKKRTLQMLEEEHQLKMELLLLDKEKKLLEIKILKQTVAKNL